MDKWSVGMWNGYVVSGKTRDERRARLEQVPDEYKQSVINHVETVFAIRRNAKRNGRVNRR